MKIRLTQHFVERQRLRNISDDLAQRVLREADAHYRDAITGWFVAVRHVQFQDKERDLALSYLHVENEILLITLHPLKRGQKERRIKSKRWIPHETPSLL